MRRLTRFLFVGGGGFVIDATILTLLVSGFGWSHYSGRAISFSAAMSATWYVNRKWVFQPTRRVGREYRRYASVQVIGALINLGVYVLAIEILPALRVVPLVPLAMGALVAVLFNYVAAYRIVFVHT